MTKLKLETGKLYIISITNLTKVEEYSTLPTDLIVKLKDIQSLLSVPNISYVENNYLKVFSEETLQPAFKILKEILLERKSQGLTTFLITNAITEKERQKLATIYGDIENTEVLFFKDDLVKDYKNTTLKSYIIEKDQEIELISSNIFETNKIDFIGDIHGLYKSFITLTEKLGYEKIGNNLVHKDNRKICILGDFIDRGPDSVELMFFIRSLVKNGHYVILGNHEAKLIKMYDKYKNNIEIQAKGGGLRTLSELMSTHKPGKVKSIIDFLRELPTYYTMEVKNVKIACTHAPLTAFSPELITKDNALYGHYRMKENDIDIDKEYSNFYKRGLNKYFLIHGHIIKSSNQDYSISLEEGSAFGGVLCAIRSEDIINSVKEDNIYDYLNKMKIRTNSNFDYKKDGIQSTLKKEMFSLVNNGLATSSISPCKFMHVFKYKSHVFLENLWHESSYLTKTRGLILDKSGKIIVHPFDKVFNYLENDTGKYFDKDKEVKAVVKMNGFLGNITKNPFNNDLMYTTTGGFDTMFSEYIRDYIDKDLEKKLKRFLSRNDLTLSFEVIHEKDPHIIEYTKKDFGLYLIGARGKKESEISLTEEELDLIGKELSIKRPEHFNLSLKEILKITEKEEIEGYLIRDLDNKQKALFKLKTPFYLHSKILGRLNYKHVKFMFENPIKFKEAVGDEDIFELVEAVIKKYSVDEFKNIPIKDRIIIVRDIIKELRK